MAKWASQEFTCIVTGQPGADCHHFKTRKSGGPDEDWNRMFLSHKLHQEIHSIGNTRFLEKYPAAKNWLLEIGWEHCPILDRWTHTKAALRFKR